MKAEEYLSRYHNMKIKMESLKEEVKVFIRLANSIPGVNFDAIRVDGTKCLDAPYVKWIHKTVDNERLIEDMETKLPIVKNEVVSIIEELEDSELKRLLIYRYIDWLSWSQIAKNMIFSPSTIRRKHDKALIQIEISQKGKDEQG